jgi:hypothetical protein
MSTSAASLAATRQWPLGLSGLRSSVSDHPDALAVGGLIAATAIVIGNRVSFDGWLARYDLFTQIIPWYRYLGSQLRTGSVPGWNPHELSGTPFAGHPLSGWMYVPAMVCFVLFPAITAFKVFVAWHLLLASLSTYAYARALRWSVVAALVSAVAFAFGPFLEWTTYTSLQFAQFAVWIPLALFGIEVSFRRSGWRDRLLPWCLAAFALSQMLAGWVGEGWIYAAPLLGGCIIYRGFGRVSTWTVRCQTIGATGLAVFGGGAALAAAGVLPRLSVNAQSSIAGGNYGALGKGGDLNPPWTARYLLTQLLGVGSGYHFRAAGFGGAVVVLSLLALILAPRRFPVPFFAALTAAGLILTLSWTPLHALFYLIPGYRNLHLHDPWRSIGLVSVGPALLSGAAVQAMTENAWRARTAPVIVAVGSAIAALALLLAPLGGVVQWAPAGAAAAVALIALFSVVDGRLNALLAAALLLVVFLQPTGLELSGSWLGWPHDPRWTSRWTADPARMAALQTELSPTDPNGAGAFLQQQLADGPFRYLGYGGVGYPHGGWHSRNYMTRRFDPDVQAILVNGRPLALGLDEVQGYDPVQLSRYDDLMRALNEKAQDYHTAFVYPEGLESPLLNLLDVRYVLVPDSLPPDRPDIAGLIETSKAVYQGSHVTVYERQPAPAHAWIVHDVRSVQPGAALPSIANGSIDPRETALIEGNAPALPSASKSSGNDEAKITVYAPDHIQIQTSVSAPSFLVLSEIYADGWKATVDGTDARMYPTDHALRGLVIPAGNATVDLRYEPRNLLIGSVLSALAALTVTIVAIDAARRYSTQRSRTG